MSFEDVCEVTNHIKYKCVEPGKYIFKQGEQAEHFYILIKGTMQLQIPSPFTDALVEPPAPKSEVKVDPRMEKRNTLRDLVLTKKPTLTLDQMKELTPLEVMKYKTRSMLNEILDSRDVVRNTVSPWVALDRGSLINPNLKVKQQQISEEGEESSSSTGSEFSPSPGGSPYGSSGKKGKEKSLSPGREKDVFITKPNICLSDDPDSEENESSEEQEPDPFLLNDEGA